MPAPPLSGGLPQARGVVRLDRRNLSGSVCGLHAPTSNSLTRPARRFCTSFPGRLAPTPTALRPGVPWAAQAEHRRTALETRSPTGFGDCPLRARIHEWLVGRAHVRGEPAYGSDVGRTLVVCRLSGPAVSFMGSNPHPPQQFSACAGRKGCLSARGALSAFALSHLDSHCPGFDRCVWACELAAGRTLDDEVRLVRLCVVYTFAVTQSEASREQGN
jgi:hypothetical protein